MENTKLIDLTPHSITFWGDIPQENGPEEAYLTVPPEAVPARVKQTRSYVSSLLTSDPYDHLHYVRITANAYGAVEDLPGVVPGTAYIVSAMVALALPGRRDLYFPNDLVRDGDGRIVGCRSLTQA